MNGAGNNKPPYVGALLRLGLMVARSRLLIGLSNRGYADLTAAHLPVFAYPFPDGVRPSELALRTNQSKQSINNVLGELERQGYVRRTALHSGGRRLVYLSRKGLTVVEICQREMLALQAELAKQVGQKRFDNFLTVLRELAAGAEPVETRSAPARSGKNAAGKRLPRHRFDRRPAAVGYPAQSKSPLRGKRAATLKAKTRG
jgi:DNA-binding MarR family transcriptional regulator